MTFATLAARVDSAVSRQLLTDVGVLDNVLVAGIFSNGAADSLTMTAQEPTFLLPSAACTRVAQGSRLRIPDLGKDGLYTVQALEPDGTGLTLLRLQKARAA
jgi:hypothetical protein